MGSDELGTKDINSKWILKRDRNAVVDNQQTGKNIETAPKGTVVTEDKSVEAMEVRCLVFAVVARLPVLLA